MARGDTDRCLMIGLAILVGVFFLAYLFGRPVQESMCAYSCPEQRCTQNCVDNCGGAYWGQCGLDNCLATCDSQGHLEEQFAASTIGNQGGMPDARMLQLYNRGNLAAIQGPMSPHLTYEGFDNDNKTAQQLKLKEAIAKSAPEEERRRLHSLINSTVQSLDNVSEVTGNMNLRENLTEPPSLTPPTISVPSVYAGGVTDNPGILDQLTSASHIPHGLTTDDTPEAFEGSLRTQATVYESFSSDDNNRKKQKSFSGNYSQLLQHAQMRNMSQSQ